MPCFFDFGSILLPSIRPPMQLPTQRGPVQHAAASLLSQQNVDVPKAGPSFGSAALRPLGYRFPGPFVVAGCPLPTHDLIYVHI